MNQSQKKKLKFQNIKRMWPFVKDDKKYLFLYILDSILEMVVTIFIPLLSAKIILRITDGLLKQAVCMGVVVLFVQLARYVLGYFKGYFYQKIHLGTMNRLQVCFAKEILKLEIKELDTASSGLFIERLNNDTRDISRIFMEISYWVTNIVSKLGILITIFVMNKYIFCYFMIIAFVYFLIQKKGIEEQNAIRKSVRKLNENQTGIIGEMVRGIRDIKVLNAHDAVLDKTQERIHYVSNETFHLMNVNRLYTLLENMILGMNAFLFLVLCYFLFQQNLITIPVIIILDNYRGQVSNLFLGFNRLMDYAKQFSLASERVFEIIYDDKFAKETFGKKHLSKVTGEFTFSDVVFSYDKKKVIDHMSFHIDANKTVAFVGKSGAGKTTIFNLLTKLYQIEEGTISLDGVDIQDLDEDSIRNNMAIITQNPYIFNFSIKENLLLANPKASMREIRKACKMACLDDYIEYLEDKYETVLGEGGLILSGGQKQRLAIARALLMKTEIILFDEATSALDNETQEEIKRAIDNLKGEYTILIIAHRLSTIIDSDKIFVVDQGKIVAEGTHQELLKSSKEYKSLYEKDLNSLN